MAAEIQGKAVADGKTAGDLSPGEHLRAEIERLGLDQVAVSKATGVSRQTINNIVNGRQDISRAMAAKLGRLTGRGSDYWLRRSFRRAGSGASRASDTGKAQPLGGTVLVNYQIVRAVKVGIIRIEPFTAMNVQAASVNLTLDDIIVTSKGEKIDIGKGQDFLLREGRAVTVSTKERIEFPYDYIGRVGTMKRLGGMGIITSLGFQIEPGFKGRLQFCMLNASGTPFRLRVGDPVVSLEIMRLNARPAPEIV